MKQFILWDSKDGDPRRGDDGSFLTDGLIGRIQKGNPYLGGYAKWVTAVSFDINDELDLEVGEYVIATYGLGGSTGTYRVYRVA